MHNKAYKAELNTASCHHSGKIQRGVRKSMTHLMRVEMRRNFLPAAVATGVDAAVGEGVVNAGRHSQTLQASSSTDQHGVMTELL